MGMDAAATDTPTPAGTWPADDPLLVRLRAARPETPDEVASPHASANQLMLERIIGAAPDTGTRRRDARPVPLSRREARRSVPWAPAVAAVAAAVAGFVIAAPFGSTGPSAAAVVRDAAVASEEALGSGRAVMTVEQDGYRDVYEYTFAGDDVGVEIVLASTSGAPSAGERRIVDGERYWRVGADPAAPWFRRTGDGTVPLSELGDDPRSLLAGLAPAAGFEHVSDDTLDGVAVTRLRATTPENVDAGELSLGEATTSGGTVTDLEVWVDGDDVVRRIDLGLTQTVDVTMTEVPGTSGDDAAGTGPPEPESVAIEVAASVRFTDIGVPNTIEAPENVREVSAEELANPAPPPGG